MQAQRLNGRNGVGSSDMSGLAARDLSGRPSLLEGLGCAGRKPFRVCAGRGFWTSLAVGNGRSSVRRMPRVCFGVSDRTFRRWRDRCEEDGEAGLPDRRLGKPSGKRVPTGTGGRGGGAVPASLRRLPGQAFPRASRKGSPFPVRLHLDEDVPAIARSFGEGSAKRGGPAQAGAASFAGNDAASGRRAAGVARRHRHPYGDVDDATPRPHLHKEQNQDKPDDVPPKLANLIRYRQA
jgi:hypothetical protein